MGLSGTYFENVRFEKNGIRVEISRLDLYATWDDITAYRLGNVKVDGVHVILPAVRPDGEEDPQDGGFALPAPLNLHVRQADFQNIRIFMPGPAGDVKISLAGSMIDRGDHYQAALDAAGDTAEALQFSGKITAQAQKATGALALHAELGEGRLALAAPDVDVKRLAGWVSADLAPGTAWPVVKAQLTAGSVKAYGIPLQGVTLTADIQEAASTVVLQGQVMNDSGEVLAEATLDRKDAARDALAVRIDSKLKNLDAFDTAGLQGEAALLLAIAGDKPREADWLSWERLSGSAALSAKNLSLPGLLRQAEADAKMNITYDPAQATLAALLSDTARLRGVILPLDGKRPVSVTLPGGAENTGLAYDTRSRAYSLRLRNVDVAAPLFSAKGLQAQLRFAPTDAALTGSLEIGELAHAATPPALVPVRLRASFDPARDRPGATAISGEVTEKNGLFYATLKGRHDWRAARGSLRFNMPPMTLREGVTDLDDVFPLSASYMRDVFGTVGLSADFDWTRQKSWALTSGGEIFLKDVTGVIEGNTLADVSGVIRLDSLFPVTFREQKLAVGAMNVGLPLTGGVMVASLDAKKRFTLHQATWSLAGGTIVSTPFSTPVDNLSADVTLTAQNLRLGDLFQIAPLEGLTAEGVVSGTLPLRLRDGEITIENGVLESMGSGKIQYSPQEMPAFLRDNTQQQIVDLRVALKAFEFESLRLTLDGTLGKDQKIGLSAKGKNPEFYGGYPVDINLNVEGPLENVLKYSPGGSRIPDNIQKQLEEYEKKHEQQ